MAVKDFSRVSPCLNLRRLAGQSFCRLQRSGKVSRACVSPGPCRFPLEAWYHVRRTLYGETSFESVGSAVLASV